MQLANVEGTNSAALAPVEIGGGWQAKIISQLEAVGPGGMPTTELREALSVDEARSPGRSAFYAALSQLRKRKIVETLGSGRLRLTRSEPASERPKSSP
jgi:hypothetical protein